MGYVRGEDRRQAALLPAAIEGYVGAEAPVRVIDAFVDGLDVEGLGFGRAVPAATGRPGYDPRDLLKLYVYGYLNEVRSSRRLERECARNLELMWLLCRLAPDFKTIADFRRDNGRHPQADDRRALPHPRPSGNADRNGALGSRLQPPAQSQPRRGPSALRAALG